MNTTRTYPAKLLLFGEYTVLNGSRALAIPLSHWQGSLRFDGSATDDRLQGFIAYLREKEIFSDIELDVFQRAIEDGLYFASDIPQGYGLGSSGALCAAIYTHFFDKGTKDITDIKHHLAAMETYFHGTSSGMDPLVSLLQAPVLREHNTYHVLSSMKWPDPLKVYLIDSGIPRTTGSLVEQYVQWSTREDYRLACIRPLVQSVDHAISFFLDGYLPGLWAHLHLISDLQTRYFAPMITPDMNNLWQSLQGHPDLVLKLCGAGGGGYYLAFAKDDVDVTATIGNVFNIIRVN